MTSKLKCPVCQWCNQPMVLQDDIFMCANTDCSACAESFLHKALIQTKQDLELTRKALDVAVDALKEYEDRDSYDCNGDWCGCEYSTAHKALEQITALEQKDIK